MCLVDTQRGVASGKRPFIFNIVCLFASPQQWLADEDEINNFMFVFFPVISKKILCERLC